MRSAITSAASWLDALRGDVIFGWRQLRKHRTLSAAAVLSLGLAIGATTAAFLLVDAVLLRSLPVAAPERLFYVATTSADPQQGPHTREHFDYPTFRQYTATAGDLADLMVVGTTARLEIRVGASQEPERVYRQFVSGNVFGTFGLQPALGRLLTPGDDRTPDAHPVAVIGHDYWTRRFGQAPDVVGTTFRLGSHRYEIVGVAPRGFTGTEPGRVTDLFIPAMMNAEAIDSPGWAWFRLWHRPKAGVTAEQVRLRLQAAFTLDRQERVKQFSADTPRARIDAYLSEQVLLEPAGSGASEVQKTFGRPLSILAALVALILLIACTNVANLLIAQAMMRAREMALRLSLGAGRARLIRLLLTESALLALLASAVGTLFGWWAAPFVASMLSATDDPVRLILDNGWRALAFGVALTMAVTALFGVMPAIRASAVAPLGALKGSDDPHAHRRLTHALIAAQTALCVFVLFVAVLFVATFERLSTRPLGFSPERVLAIDIESRTDGARSPEAWARLLDQLRQTPGARAAHIVSRVTSRMLGMVCLGSLAGLAGGLTFARVVEQLLFEIRATDAATLATPILALAAAAILAAVPPALRAARIDPATTLRSE